MTSPQKIIRYFLFVSVSKWIQEKTEISFTIAFADQRSTSIKLDWSKRSAICKGIARGLAFLHEELVPHIVHRDIKSSNILLDKDFNPKIGDFGLAKLFPDNITHISTRIMGTTYASDSFFALVQHQRIFSALFSFEAFCAIVECRFLREIIH